MNRETGAWLAVALLSISALGVSATTLESTMTTDANDVIDLDYDKVPIGQDTASNALDEIEGREGSGDAASRPDPNAEEQVQSSKTRPDGSQRESSSTSDPGEGPQAQSQQQESSQDGGLSDPEGPSLLDRLLALLPYLLAVVAVLGAIGLAVRYRERLLALFEDPDSEGSEDPAPADADVSLDEASPAHAVERAWLRMVEHLDLDQPGTMTTSECARAAVEAGLDRDAVRTLTETYEEVRYGGRPVTERRERAARQSQQRLDVGGGV